MTYNPNDPNNVNDPNYRGPNRRAFANDMSYTGWIIGGVVVLAIILSIAFLIPGDNSNLARNDNAVSTTARPAAPMSSTTGSGTTSPQRTTPAPATAPAR